MSEALLSVPKLDDSSSSGSVEMITKWAFLTLNFVSDGGRYDTGAEVPYITISLPMKVTSLYILFAMSGSDILTIQSVSENAESFPKITASNMSLYDGSGYAGIKMINDTSVTAKYWTPIGWNPQNAMAEDITFHCIAVPA